jgi:hypothetical protein
LNSLELYSRVPNFHYIKPNSLQRSTVEVDERRKKILSLLEGTRRRLKTSRDKSRYAFFVSTYTLAPVIGYENR